MSSVRRHLDAIAGERPEPFGVDRPSPAIIVPEQFFDLTPGRHVPGGVRRLMVAILEDAICVYRKHRRAATRDRRRLHHRARRWFESEDRSSVFSFLRITEALGIEPDLVKRALRGPAGAEYTPGALARPVTLPDTR